VKEQRRVLTVCIVSALAGGNFGNAPFCLHEIIGPPRFWASVASHPVCVVKNRRRKYHDNQCDSCTFSTDRRRPTRGKRSNTHTAKLQNHFAARTSIIPRFACFEQNSRFLLPSAPNDGIVVQPGWPHFLSLTLIIPRVACAEQNFAFLLP